MNDEMWNRRNIQNDSNHSTIVSNKRANSLNPNNDLQGLANRNNFEREDTENELEEQNDIQDQEVINEQEDNESNSDLDTTEDTGNSSGSFLGEAAKNKFVQFCIKHPHAIPIILIVGGCLIILIFIILAVVASTDAEASDINSGGSGSYNSANAASTDACAQISVPINEYLEEKGSSLDEFNNYIVSEVRSAGLGTREGVVAAAVSLVGGLCQNYGGKFPYKYSGAHPSNFYGADSSWGKSIPGGFTYPNVSYVYYYEGPDCSGFVFWAIHNGGYKAQNLGASSFGTLGAVHSMSSFTGQPGDILFSDGHVVLIVGISGDNYLIAEAAGGDEGTRITSIPKNSGPYQVVDMTAFYSNDSNKDMASYPQATAVDTKSNSDTTSDEEDENSSNEQDEETEEDE